MSTARSVVWLESAIHRPRIWRYKPIGTGKQYLSSQTCSRKAWSKSATKTLTANKACHKNRYVVIASPWLRNVQDRGRRAFLVKSSSQHETAGLPNV